MQCVQSLVLVALLLTSSCALLNALDNASDASDEPDDVSEGEGESSEGEGEGDGEGEGEGEGEGGGDGDGDVPNVTCSGGPLLTARQVAVGFDRSCALRCDGEITCWGNGATTGTTTSPPPGPFTSVTVGQMFACGLRPNGDVDCWGYTVGLDQPTDSFGDAIPMSTVLAGQDFLCGLDVGGELFCWNASDWPGFSAPTGVFLSLAVGWGYLCAVSGVTGILDCAGTTSAPNPPHVPLTHLGVGSNFACGLDENGSILCFDDEDLVDVGATLNGYVELGVGDGTVCAIRDTLFYVECFTIRDEGELVVANVPPGIFKSVAVATKHACAIRDDDVVVCWGDDGFGRIGVPAP